MVCDRPMPVRPKAASLPPSQGQAPLVGVHTGQTAPDNSQEEEAHGLKLHTAELRKHKSRTQQYQRSQCCTRSADMHVPKDRINGGHNTKRAKNLIQCARYNRLAYRTCTLFEGGCCTFT